MNYCIKKSKKNCSGVLVNILQDSLVSIGQHLLTISFYTLVASFVILVTTSSENSPLLTVPQRSFLLLALLLRKAGTFYDSLLLCSASHNRKEFIKRVFVELGCELGWVTLTAAGFMLVTGWNKCEYPATVLEVSETFYTDSDITPLNNRDSTGNNIQGLQ